MPFLVAGITLLIKPGQRLFHLDGYKQGGTEHEFFASFVGEPDYDKVKAAVLEILHGKRKPRSRTLSSGPRSGPGAAVVPPHHRWRAMIYVVDNNEVMEHLTPAPQQRVDDAHAVAAAITRTL